MARKELYGTGNGDRVQMRRCADDLDPIPTGTEGTVTLVDDAGTVHVQWDNGRTLGMIPGEDTWTVIGKAGA